jgi:hypothetical protein
MRALVCETHEEDNERQDNWKQDILSLHCQGEKKRRRKRAPYQERTPTADALWADENVAQAEP